MRSRFPVAAGLASVGSLAVPAAALAQLVTSHLSSDAGANLVTFSLGGKNLQYSPGPGLEEIFLRTRAVNDPSSVVVQNLVLDAVNVGDPSSASGPDGLDI